MNPEKYLGKHSMGFSRPNRRQRRFNYYNRNRRAITGVETEREQVTSMPLTSSSLGNMCRTVVDPSRARAGGASNGFSFDQSIAGPSSSSTLLQTTTMYNSGGLQPFSIQTAIASAFDQLPSREPIRMVRMDGQGPNHKPSLSISISSNATNQPQQRSTTPMTNGGTTGSQVNDSFNRSTYRNVSEQAGSMKITIPNRVSVFSRLQSVSLARGHQQQTTHYRSSQEMQAIRFHDAKFVGFPKVAALGHADVDVDLRPQIEFLRNQPLLVPQQVNLRNQSIVDSAADDRKSPNENPPVCQVGQVRCIKLEKLLPVLPDSKLEIRIDNMVEQESFPSATSTPMGNLTNWNLNSTFIPIPQHEGRLALRTEVDTSMEDQPKCDWNWNLVSRPIPMYAECVASIKTVIGTSVDNQTNWNPNSLFRPIEMHERGLASIKTEVDTPIEDQSTWNWNPLLRPIPMDKGFLGIKIKTEVVDTSKETQSSWASNAVPRPMQEGCLAIKTEIDTSMENQPHWSFDTIPGPMPIEEGCLNTYESYSSPLSIVKGENTRIFERQMLKLNVKKIDPMREICPAELSGSICNNATCQLQHLLKVTQAAKVK